MSADWYKHDREFLQDTFGGDWQLIAALLAATSPQVQLIISWNWTLRIYKDYRTGQPIRLDGLRGCHRSNVLRALAGEPLSGRKVQNFYKALLGDTNAVVLDTWMLKLFRWYPRHKNRPTPKQYDKLAKRLAAFAKLHGYEPVEFQAILWISYRLKHGYKPTSYSRVGQDKNQYTFEDLD